MLASQRYFLTGTFTTASSSSSPSPSLSPRCSLRTNPSTIPQLSHLSFTKSLEPPTHPLESTARPNIPDAISQPQNSLRHGGAKDPRAEGDDEEISGVEVPRQKYIPVSKAELLDAITTMLLDSQQDVAQFHLLSSCLDSILHAEHKSILEEMRADYSLSQSMESEGTSSEVLSGSDGEVVINGKKSYSASGDGYSDSGNVERNEELEVTEADKPLPFNYSLDLSQLRNLLSSSSRNDTRCSNGESRVAVATRFQRAFMQLLSNAQFEELSARDLMLTSALNTDYLLTLPIYVDWKKASESNAIIFRRGYATERQKGLLIVEKLDYIQSKLLQIIFSSISKPLGKVGTWINETLKNASQTQEVQNWNKRMKLWLKELSAFRQLYSSNEEIYNNLLGADQLSDRDLPIWLASQRAVSRYEGLLSSAGPRGRLFKKLLTRIGLIPPTPETTFQLDSDSNASEHYLRPIFLSRISLSDIWRPASRKLCGNNLWKMIKTSVSILLSQSVLKEPAFQELILLYTDEVGDREMEIAAVPSLQLKIYEKIPIPELPVIFPHKKLSFRIIDTVRLDIASILGLSAYFINYKFEDILSPSAVFLDVVATGALILYISRVALGYKQTWDRYQLLVNRTLYEKTLASGFGSVHFLLDASEQQQYKEAILAYAIMLKANKGQFFLRQVVGDECERFMYDVFKIKVEMPVEKAMETLVRLGLVTETEVNGSILVQAVPCPDAYEALKQRWNGLLN